MKKLIVANAEVNKAVEKQQPRTEYANLYLQGTFGALTPLKADVRNGEHGITIAIHRDENGDFTVEKIAEF